jgi:hypothetical protein
MFENPQPIPASDREIAGFVRPFAIRVATINGVLAAIGIAIAMYVYFAFNIPAKIDHHSVGRFGQPIEPENALIYLFSFPSFQIWLAIMPWLGTRRREQQTSEAQSIRLQALFPWITPAPNSVGLHRSVLMLLVFAEALILTATIYRAVLAALSSV